MSTTAGGKFTVLFPLVSSYSDLSGRHLELSALRRLDDADREAHRPANSAGVGNKGRIMWTVLNPLDSRPNPRLIRRARSKCVRRRVLHTKATAERASRRLRATSRLFGMLHLVPAGVLKTAKPLTPTRKSQFKTHSCRVRRKHERLPSNGLIRSNPAIGSSLYSGLPSAGSLQIRSYVKDLERLALHRPVGN